MSEPLVRVEHLAKTYTDDGYRVEVLRNVNFSIGRAEMVALLGVSGVGKTTLLQIMGGLDEATSGSVIINGRQVGRLPARELASFRSGFVGFVHQFHHLLPDFTAVENAFMPGLIAGRSRKECTERAHELLEAVGLGHRTRHYPSELSGGERQRVALARALFNNPALVLADEPTGNLDRENGVHLLELFRKMREERGQTFLVATHNEQLAQGLDRVLYLESGSISPTGAQQDASNLEH
ncbi:MAG: ATP-binding cassette domain-containing protein [Chitinivibrionales bacterium]|nr:ATP-binding cassette domain-containing protein [Chitinivibrionales bacterium]